MIGGLVATEGWVWVLVPYRHTHARCLAIAEELPLPSLVDQEQPEAIRDRGTTTGQVEADHVSSEPSERIHELD